VWKAQVRPPVIENGCTLSPLAQMAQADVWWRGREERSYDAQRQSIERRRR
jgi:hypothetical protein